VGFRVFSLRKAPRCAPFSLVADLYPQPAVKYLSLTHVSRSKHGCLRFAEIRVQLKILPQPPANGRDPMCMFVYPRNSGGDSAAPSREHDTRHGALRVVPAGGAQGKGWVGPGWNAPAQDRAGTQGGAPAGESAVWWRR